MLDQTTLFPILVPAKIAKKLNFCHMLKKKSGNVE